MSDGNDNENRHDIDTCECSDCLEAWVNKPLNRPTRVYVVRMPEVSTLDRLARACLPHGFDAHGDLSRWFGRSWCELPGDAPERLEWYRTTHPFMAA